MARSTAIAEPWRRRRRAVLLARAVAAGPPALAQSVVFVCVYRRKNACYVLALLNQLPVGTDIRLWALDEPSAELAEVTIGQGPGDKFAIIDKVIEAKAIAPGAHLIVADDDVFLAKGHIADLVGLLESAGFGLMQPAHDWSSWVTYPALYARPWRTATMREVIEIGPLFVIHGAWRGRVANSFASAGMGWGLELSWSKLQSEGLRLGVADSCPMVHCAEPGLAYDMGNQQANLDFALRGSGVADILDLFRWRKTWLRWQPSPPWPVDVVALEPERPEPALIIWTASWLPASPGSEAEAKRGKPRTVATS